MGVRLVPVACLVAAVLAGCFGSPASPADTSPTASGTPSPSGAAPAADLPRLGDPVRATLFFTADGGLSWEAPNEGSIPIGMPSTWPATGVRPTEFLSAPLGQGLLIAPEDIAVTAYVQSALPQFSNGVFDFAAQVGSTRASGAWTYTAAPNPATAPGSVQEFRVTLSFGDRSGLVVLPGDSLRAIAIGQMGAETGEPHLLVGGEQASRIELTLQNYTVDPTGPLAPLGPESFTGQLTGAGTVPTCDASPGTTSLTHDVEVAADAVAFEAVLESGSGGDVDLFLSDGGSVVASGTSAEGRESVFLAAETLSGLQGRTLTLKAVACATGPLDYEIEVEQSRAG